MTPASPSAARTARWRTPTPATAIALALVLAGGVAAGALAAVDPVLAVATVALALLSLAVVRSPDLATFAVVFILYSNIAVVATRFHGVPRLVASAFPLLLAAPLLRDALLHRRGILVAPALPPLVLLLAVHALGMAFSADLEVTSRAVFEFFLEGLLIFFLITNAVRTRRALRLAVWALLLAGFVSAIVPCYQQLTGRFDSPFGGLGQTSEVGFRTGQVTPGGEARQIRLAGPIGEQNRYAQNMLVLLPLGFLLFVGARARWRRLLALALTVVIGAGFLLAFSRGGAVAFAITLVVMALMRVVAARHLALVAVFAIVALAALPQYWTRLKTIEQVSELVAGSPSGEKLDTALTGRVTEMLAAGLVFVDHPLIGVGPGMFKHYSEEYGNRLGIRKLEGTRKAHSLYLEVAAEGGILGLACFLTAVLVTLHGIIVARRRLLRSPPGETPAAKSERLELAHVATGLLLAMIAYLASALFLHLAYIRFFYLLLALASAAGGIALSQLGGRPDPASVAASGHRRPFEWEKQGDAGRL